MRSLWVYIYIRVNIYYDIVTPRASGFCLWARKSGLDLSS